MRWCSHTISEHSCLADLPVLTFLVPRLLAPWPISVGTERRHSSLPEIRAPKRDAFDRCRYRHDTNLPCAKKESVVPNGGPYPCYTICSSPSVEAALGHRNLHTSSRYSNDQNIAGIHASSSCPISVTKATHYSSTRPFSTQSFRAATNTSRPQESVYEKNAEDNPELSESAMDPQDLFEPEDDDLAWPQTLFPSFLANWVKSSLVTPTTARVSEIPSHKRVLWAKRRRKKIRNAPKPQQDVRSKRVSLIRRLNSPGDIGDIENEDETLGLEKYSTIWVTRIARLAGQYDSQLSPASQWQHRARFQAPQSMWISDLVGGGTVNHQRASWMRLSPATRASCWPHMMLWYLENFPAKALGILLASNTHPLPPGYQVADALDLIACHVGEQADQAHMQSIAQLSEGLRSILHEHKDPPPITQRTILTLLRQCTLTEAASLYELLELHGVTIHTNTMLHFANVFANAGGREQALKILSTAVKPGGDMTALAFQKICGKLLRAARTYVESSKLMQSLFRFGVQLNIVMYNILIMNAVDAKDFGTVWKIYNIMEEHDLRPDNYTYSILLRATRLTSDHFTWRELYAQIRSDRMSGLLQLSPVLVTELLWSFYYFGRLTNFQDVLDEYEKHCDLQPLKDLGMVSDHQSSSYVTGPRPLPCTATLVVMILIYVRKSQRILPAALVYRNFQRLLKAEDPCIVPLIASTYTLNIFLKAFSRTHGSLKLWPVLMRDMTTPLPAHVMNRDTKQPLKPCKPTAQTWNILLNAFMRRKKVAAAEKMVELMRRHNMKLDTVTWNSLVGGYARMQYVENVVEVLKRMKTEGSTIDQYTIEGLQHVQDKPRLMNSVMNLYSENVSPKDGVQQLPAIRPTKAGVGTEVMDSSDQTEKIWTKEDLFEDED